MMKLTRLIVLSSILLLTSASFASTGYYPAQFIGKCDPWPGNQPLTNEELKACYVSRYGVEPGANPTRIGYCCELFGLNWDALRNWCRSTNPNSDCTPTTTEMTDASFVEARGGRFIYDWVVKFREGGTPGNRVTVSEPSQPCGNLDLPKTLFNSYTYYVTNVPPCGETPQPPPPPPVEPPPTPTLPDCTPLVLGPAVPSEVWDTAAQIRTWGDFWGAGKKARIRRMGDWVRSYQPALQSTPVTPCVLRTLP